MKFSQSSPDTEWRPKTARGETVGFVANTTKAPERGERIFWRPAFCRPVRGLHVLATDSPTVSPIFRASGALVVMILFFAVGALAEATSTLSDSEIEGRNLAQQILEQSPSTDFAQIGVLKIRDKKGSTTNVYVLFQTSVTAEDWQTIYEARASTNGVPYARLKIIHKHDQPNRYFLMADEHGLVNLRPLDSTALNGNQTMIPFANSDFWIADLGLEFFHWPQQKIVKKEFWRNCSCMVLESTNPNPSPGGYSRVVSWIDKESGGIVEADAYDVNGKKLKNFYPKNLKKVKGEWQVQSMQIENIQTGSRTRLEFDLNK